MLLGTFSERLLCSEGPIHPQNHMSRPLRLLRPWFPLTLPLSVSAARSDHGLREPILGPPATASHESCGPSPSETHREGRVTLKNTSHTVSLLQIFQGLLMSLQLKEPTDEPPCGPWDSTASGDPCWLHPFFCSTLFSVHLVPNAHLGCQAAPNPRPLHMAFACWEGFLCSSWLV